jgi:response regulator NasT
VKILIAEDESIIRMDLRETLERAGHSVVAEAGDGREAVRLAETLRPDACLLDIKMPLLSGLTAALRITKKKIAPCVILTAYRDRKLIDRARRAGAYTFLVKPFQEPELLGALELAATRFEELRALERELDGARSALEARKLIDRAKGLLMDRHGLKEAEAFRVLQKRAMETRRSLSDIAREVLAGEAKP